MSGVQFKGKDQVFAKIAALHFVFVSLGISDNRCHGFLDKKVNTQGFRDFGCGIYLNVEGEFIFVKLGITALFREEDVNLFDHDYRSFIDFWKRDENLRKAFLNAILKTNIWEERGVYFTALKERGFRLRVSNDFLLDPQETV